MLDENNKRIPIGKLKFKTKWSEEFTPFDSEDFQAITIDTSPHE